jgi:hypothetical protein
LNGVPIGGPGGAFSGAPLRVRTSGAVGGTGPFRAGANCVRVDVEDRFGVAVGLDASGTVEARER